MMQIVMALVRSVVIIVQADVTPGSSMRIAMA